ncbi:MAG TPA: type II secretion system F family protein [Acidimicrobiia bacterium]
MSALAYPWLAAVIAGAVAALPLARAARRVTVADQARDLGPRRLDATSAAPRHVGAAVSVLIMRVPAVAVVGRVARGLRARARDGREAERLGRELPLLADLLAVAVGAGATPYLAVQAASRWAPPRCAARLRALMHSCRLGVGFDVALAELGTSTPSLRPLTDTLAVSERTGAPIGPALARLADDARASTRRHAEARARTVPVRLLFPLVFLVLPAFALLTVAPALLSGLART